MNEKILTISIAAYNMEEFIRENVDSILASDFKEDLEIFIVDDGGRDKTLEIAEEYQKKYPGIVFAIHKENGGYGSVQNYTMSHATGKYFKILDGDDWVDTNGLTELVKFLKTSDCDAVITNYYKCLDKKNKFELHRVSDKYKNGIVYEPNEITSITGMWALTYKTEILKKSALTLPEHTLYTDRIYVTIPFSYVKTVTFLKVPVYCYRTGRDGQSISRESRIKHINEYLKVTEIICKYYVNDNSENKKYLLLCASAQYKVSIRALLLLPSTKDNLLKIKNYEKKIKSISKDIYKKSASLKTRMGWVITFLRMTNYLGYWILGKISKDIIDF